MKRNAPIFLILLAALAVLIAQRRDTTALSRAIAGLNTEIGQITQETEQRRADMKDAAAALADAEHRALLPTQAASANLSVGTGPTKVPDQSTDASVRSDDQFWSDESDSVWIGRDVLHRLGVRVLTMDTNHAWRVSDNAAAVLLLTASERAALDRAVATILFQFRELEWAHFSQVVETSPEEEAEGLWKVQFKVAAFPEEAATLRTQLADSVLEILGHERGELFMKFKNRRTEMDFDTFGARDRMILLSYTLQPSGQWSLDIAEKRGSRSKSCGTGWQKRWPGDIPAYWRHLIPFPDLATNADSAQ